LVSFPPFRATKGMPCCFRKRLEPFFPFFFLSVEEQEASLPSPKLDFSFLSGILPPVQKAKTNLHLTPFSPPRLFRQTQNPPQPLAEEYLLLFPPLLLSGSNNPLLCRFPNSSDPLSLQKDNGEISFPPPPSVSPLFSPQFAGDFHFKLRNFFFYVFFFPLFRSSNSRFVVLL